MRGHYCAGWVVVDGKRLQRIALPPDDEPAPLSRVVARRWYSNDLIFDTTELEDDAELAARTALEERRPLGDIKGVVPSLRAAFGHALGIAVARELDIEITPRELTAHAFSAEDESTIAALDSALGKVMRYMVVAPAVTIARSGDGSVERVSPEPWWAALLRLASGMRKEE